MTPFGRRGSLRITTHSSSDIWGLTSIGTVIGAKAARLSSTVVGCLLIF
jgi:hypothetical protein